MRTVTPYAYDDVGNALWLDPTGRYTIQAERDPWGFSTATPMWWDFADHAPSVVGNYGAVLNPDTGRWEPLGFVPTGDANDTGISLIPESEAIRLGVRDRWITERPAPFSGFDFGTFAGDAILKAGAALVVAPLAADVWAGVGDVFASTPATSTALYDPLLDVVSTSSGAFDIAAFDPLVNTVGIPGSTAVFDVSVPAWVPTVNVSVDSSAAANDAAQFGTGAAPVTSNAAQVWDFNHGWLPAPPHSGMVYDINYGWIDNAEAARLANIDAAQFGTADAPLGTGTNYAPLNFDNPQISLPDTTGYDPVTGEPIQTVPTTGESLPTDFPTTDIPKINLPGVPGVPSIPAITTLLPLVKTLLPLVTKPTAPKPYVDPAFPYVPVVDPNAPPTIIDTALNTLKANPLAFAGLAVLGFLALKG